jgi:hypothetical protein
MNKRLMMAILVCVGFGAVAAPPAARARIDLMSKKMVAITPEKSTVKGFKAANASWVKDANKRASYITSQGPALSTDTWSDYKVAFTPAGDGTVSINLMSNYYFIKDETGKNKMMPRWVLWDNVTVEGAELVNGDFEIEAAGKPKGWNINKNNYIKQDDGKIIKAWHNSRASQSIHVTKGQMVTITAKVKAFEK